jgi:hypothetical protein
MTITANTTIVSVKEYQLLPEMLRLTNSEVV